MDPEEAAWMNVDPDDIWVMDKLILSRKLGYRCGPTGQRVPSPDYYIVRPCVNLLGVGLGAEKVWLEDNTDHLPLGYFWCEWFEGRHLSVDYNRGLQKLCVEGFKAESTLTQWKEWKRVQDHIQRPAILNDLFPKYKWINCEFIDGNLIEVHLRHNPDFENNIEHFIPVWEGEPTTPPEGFRYINYPEVHGRIGAFIK